MNKKINKIIIATGGTGGHVIPAYCLAKHLVEKKLMLKLSQIKEVSNILKIQKRLK